LDIVLCHPLGIHLWKASYEFLSYEPVLYVSQDLPRGMPQSRPPKPGGHTHCPSYSLHLPEFRQLKRGRWQSKQGGHSGGRSSKLDIHGLECVDTDSDDCLACVDATNAANVITQSGRMPATTALSRRIMELAEHERRRSDEPSRMLCWSLQMVQRQVIWG
jgi:hypothetical protein